jgi:hypothetical protein
MSERCHDVWGVSTEASVEERGGRGREGRGRAAWWRSARVAADQDTERGAVEERTGSGREGRVESDVVEERAERG